MKRKIIIITAVLWTLFIFGQSLLPGEVSSDQSGFVVDVLYPLITKIGIQIKVDTFSFIIRKLAHFTEYFILGLILHLIYQKSHSNKFFIMIITHGLITASIDETIQLFTPNRSGELRDVMIDTLGVITAILFIKIIKMLFKKEAKII